MGQELAGKVAIITGSASGIGRASAQLFAREGARIVVADVNDQGGEELVAEIGDAAVYQHADVSRREDVRALVDCAVERFGRLDIMFNNAGISGNQHPRLLDDDLTDFDRVIGINLFGVMAGTRYAGEYMSKHGGGIILNTASIAGLYPGQALTSYRTSKAAVIHYTKCSAVDLAEYSIRVNCLVPGHIRTPLTAFTIPGMDEEQMRKVRQALAPVWDANQPLKRHGHPADVANANVESHLGLALGLLTAGLGFVLGYALDWIAEGRRIAALRESDRA